jgi:hypothetical protein
MSRTAEPTRLDEDDLQAAVLRMWTCGLAHGADRPDVRRLAGGLLAVLHEAERLRRAGRSVAVPLKVRALLLAGLRARGCEPPAGA